MEIGECLDLFILTFECMFSNIYSKKIHESTILASVQVVTSENVTPVTHHTGGLTR
jgi:hypothetical protein